MWMKRDGPTANRETHRPPMTEPTRSIGPDFARQLATRFSRAPMVNNQWFRICGFTICLRFTDEILARQLGRAWMCFQTEAASEADLTIHVGAGDTFPLPEIPQCNRVFGRRSELITDPDSGLEAAYMLGPDILSVLGPEPDTAFFWIRNAGSLPGFEQAAPFRYVLHWFLRKHGWMLVHAAAVGKQDQGVLVCGKGGSGKSTLAAAARGRPDWQFAGDDYCAVTATAPFEIAPVYPTAKLTADTVRMLDLPDKGAATDDEKQILFAAEDRTTAIPKKLTLNGIVLPARTSGPPSIRKASRSETARHLAVSSLFQMPHAGQPDHRIISEIIHQNSCWELSVTDNQPVTALPILEKLLRRMETGRS